MMLSGIFNIVSINALTRTRYRIALIAARLVSRGR
jgi:hypothetical protein